MRCGCGRKDQSMEPGWEEKVWCAGTGFCDKTGRLIMSGYVVSVLVLATLTLVGIVTFFLPGTPSDPLCPVSIGVNRTAGSITGNVHYVREGVYHTPNVSITCLDTDQSLEADTMVTGAALGDGFFELQYEQRQSDSDFCEWDCGTPSQQRPDIVCRFQSPEIISYQTCEYANWREECPLLMSNYTVYPDRRPGCADLNGCGPKGFGFTVPDQEFGLVCDNHDCCYNTCGETRKNCDDEMYGLSLMRCRETEWFTIHFCYERAWLMYKAVRVGGFAPWVAAQNDFNCTDTSIEENELLPRLTPENEGCLTTEEQSRATYQWTGVVIASVAGALTFIVMYTRGQRAHKVKVRKASLRKASIESGHST